MYAAQMIHLSESTTEAQLRLQQEHAQKQQVWAWRPVSEVRPSGLVHSSTGTLGSERLQLTISSTCPEPLYLQTDILALNISSFVLTHVHKKHKHENSTVWKLALCTTTVKIYSALWTPNILVF